MVLGSRAARISSSNSSSTLQLWRHNGLLHDHVEVCGGLGIRDTCGLSCSTAGRGAGEWLEGAKGGQGGRRGWCMAVTLKEKCLLQWEVCVAESVCRHVAAPRSAVLALYQLSQTSAAQHTLLSQHSTAQQPTCFVVPGQACDCICGQAGGSSDLSSSQAQVCSLGAVPGWVLGAGSGFVCTAAPK